MQAKSAKQAWIPSRMSIAAAARRAVLQRWKTAAQTVSPRRNITDLTTWENSRGVTSVTGQMWSTIDAARTAAQRPPAKSQETWAVFSWDEKGCEISIWLAWRCKWVKSAWNTFIMMVVPYSVIAKTTKYFHLMRRFKKSTSAQFFFICKNLVMHSNYSN